MSDLKPLLSGRAAALYKGIFEEGKRHTIIEWGRILYGRENGYAQIGYLRHKLLDAGFPVVPMPIDPEKPHEPGVLVPLTSSEEVARFANRRLKTQSDAIMETLGRFFIEELQVFPTMREDIVAMLSDSRELQAATLKMVEANKNRLNAG